MPKTLENYKQLAASKGGEYILDTIPRNVGIPVEGWKCDKGHIFSAATYKIVNPDGLE
jgi:hypothetical protein